MALERLDHYFVYCTDLDASRSFYADILGLEVGDRPDFNFPGYWLYLDGRPVVHLGNDKFEGGMGNASTRKRGIGGSTGPVDHIAFNGSDIDAFVGRFEAVGLEFNRREVPGFDLHQLFVKDPDGVTIELNFWAKKS